MYDVGGSVSFRLFRLMIAKQVCRISCWTSQMCTEIVCVS